MAELRRPESGKGRRGDETDDSNQNFYICQPLYKDAEKVKITGQIYLPLPYTD